MSEPPLSPGDRVYIAGQLQDGEPGAEGKVLVVHSDISMVYVAHDKLFGRKLYPLHAVKVIEHSELSLLRHLADGVRAFRDSLPGGVPASVVGEVLIRLEQVDSASKGE